MQVLVGFNGCGVITVFPERSLLTRALVVFLGAAAGGELHAFSDNVRTCVFDQQMNVIGRHHVIEHAQTETLLRFKEPVQVATAITRKLQDKFSLITAVRDVPKYGRADSGG